MRARGRKSGTRAFSRNCKDKGVASIIGAPHAPIGTIDTHLQMLWLEGQCEPVDDGPQNLEQLADAAVGLHVYRYTLHTHGYSRGAHGLAPPPHLCLVDEAVEDVSDGLAHKGPQRHELACRGIQGCSKRTKDRAAPPPRTVDAVEDGLEVVPLAGVLRVENFDELGAERRVDEALRGLGLHLRGVGGACKAGVIAAAGKGARKGRTHLWGHDEPQQELIDDLINGASVMSMAHSIGQFRAATHL